MVLRNTNYYLIPWIHIPKRPCKATLTRNSLLHLILAKRPRKDRNILLKKRRDRNMSAGSFTNPTFYLRMFIFKWLIPYTFSWVTQSLQISLRKSNCKVIVFSKSPALSHFRSRETPRPPSFSNCEAPSSVGVMEAVIIIACSFGECPWENWAVMYEKACGISLDYFYLETSMRSSTEDENGEACAVCLVKKETVWDHHLQKGEQIYSNDVVRLHYQQISRIFTEHGADT